jgi:hypothetical protein
MPIRLSLTGLAYSGDASLIAWGEGMTYGSGFSPPDRLRIGTLEQCGTHRTIQESPMRRPPAMRLYARNTLYLLVAVFLTVSSRSARAQLPGQIELERPGDRDFVLDLANMIDDSDEQSIKELADKLLTDKAAPIIVVTIESMEKHGGAGLRIETFATLLFDQWEIGPANWGKTPGTMASSCWSPNRTARHASNWGRDGNARRMHNASRSWTS